MFIGGHLANADPAASVTSFTQQFKGAQVVSAGALGGKAACVQDGTGSNSVAMCAWFDNDSFGEVVSPTMNASALANAMHTVRPSVELRAAKWRPTGSGDAASAAHAGARAGSRAGHPAVQPEHEAVVPMPRSASSAAATAANP